MFTFISDKYLIGIISKGKHGKFVGVNFPEDNTRKHLSTSFKVIMF